MKYIPPKNDPTKTTYSDADINLGIVGDVVSGEVIDAVQREIVTAITASGINPTNDDYTQLSQAIAKKMADIVIPLEKQLRQELTDAITSVREDAGNAYMPYAGGIFIGGVHENYLQVDKIVNGVNTVELDLTRANFFGCTGTTTTNINFINIPTENAAVVTVSLIITGGANKTVHWPSGTKWNGNEAPDLQVLDVITFCIFNAGNTILAWHSYTAE